VGIDAKNQKPCPAVGGMSTKTAAQNHFLDLRHRNAQDEELRCDARVAVEAASSSWAVPVKWITPSDALIFRELWLASSCKLPNDPCKH
jgi:hypothetical protein